jgi:serine phosphatase RsbU (regulator of sigma subunit)
LDISLVFEKYIHLPREEALTEYSDDKNLKSLRIYLVIVSGILLITSIVYLSKAGLTSASAIFNSIFFLTAFFLRIYFKKIFSVKNARKGAYILLISFMLVIMVSHIITNITTVKTDNFNLNIGTGNNFSKTEIDNDNENSKADLQIDDAKNSDNYTDVIFLFCISVLFFKFSRNELIQLFSIGFGVTFASIFIFSGNIASGNIPNLVFSALFCIISLTSESKHKKKFFRQYDYFRTKHSDNIRIKQELNYAREMQISMLPENNAVIDDVEISAVSVPASEVGGDYFDYFKISENKIGIFICDVSGHGVVSALLLSGLRSCMHLILEETSNPREVFNKLNKMIRKTQSRKMFVTAIFAVIDIKENSCTLFNAGHLPPYKISGESSELFKIRKHGITLGAMDILEKKEGESEVKFEFIKKDKLIFYTDGLIEATNSQKEEFGFERLEHFLNANADAGSKQLLEKLNKHIENYTQNTQQKDDSTIVIIGRI